MNEIDELNGKFRNEQSKYAYYIIALCVAGIGFSVTQTMGRGLEEMLWPLGVSVFLFCVSILCGLKFLKYVISGIYADINIKQIVSGESVFLLSVLRSMGIPHVTEQAKGAALEGIHKAVSKNSDWASFWGRSQDWCFYFAVLFFVIWRILEMSTVSP